MSQLRALAEDIRALLSLAPSTSGALVSEPGYSQLRDLLQALLDSPDLDCLSAEELRALTTFRITVYRAGLMEPTTGRMHVGQTWRGAAKQAILKLPLGPAISAAYHVLMFGVA